MPPAPTIATFRMMTKVSCYAGILGLLVVSSAYAQEEKVTELSEVEVKADKTAAQNKQTYQAQSSSVATQTDTPIIEIPQTIHVVTKQKLEDRQPHSLDEALNTITGVKQSNTLGGTQDAIQKRGFGGNRDNSIMRNGLQSVQARNFTPTTERVEVLKGPASLLYGIQDPGGIINVVTKKPQEQASYEISDYMTSFGGGGQQVDLTGPLSDSGLSYRLIADQQDYNYWRNFGEIEQGVVAPSLLWKNDQTSVLVDYEHMDYSIPFDRGTYIDTKTGKPINVPREQRLDETYNITSGRADSANLKIDHEINSRWSVHAGYGYSSNYYNDDQMRVTAINSATGVVTRRADATKDADQQAHTATFYTVGKIPQGTTVHEITTGVQYMHNYRTLGDLYRNATVKNYNMYSPTYGTSAYPSTVSAADSDQTDKLRTSAIYMQDSWSLDEHWILVGGGRYDHYNELTGKGRPFVVRSHPVESKFVPRAGVVYMVTPEWSVYTSYTESFRPNTSIATMIGELPAEEGQSWEVGTKWQTDRLTTTAALFNINKKNVLTAATDSAGDTYYRVAGRVRSRGLETDVSGELNDRWSAFAGYSFTDAEVLEDPELAGTPVDGVSKHMASLGLTRNWGQVMGGQVRTGASSRYTGTWYIGNTEGVMYSLPASMVYDLFASYERKVSNHPVKLQFNVKNLFDETYYTSGVSNANVPMVAYGDPREFLFRVSVGL
ncbi:MAG: TonB-dependent siderophore receptor [Tolumonas sp.]|nr:TonB-dependent siderophore receptor [Tolumonas sp.]